MHRHHRHSRGFTLIETLIAMGILVTGLVAVAGMFAYSARTNLLNEQRTTATLLATSKMEELRAVSSLDDLTNGGDLDPANKVNDYFEYVGIASTGAIVESTSDTSLPYLRLWAITDTNPKVISVSVYAQNSGVSGQSVELIRAATNLTNGF